MVRTGDRVWVFAKVFDENNDHDWSKSQFGDNWKSAKCVGTCKKIYNKSNYALVTWDIDKRTTRVPCSLLHIETNVHNSKVDADQRDYPDHNNEPGAAPNESPTKRKRDINYLISSSESDTSSSDSDSDEQNENRIIENNVQHNSDVEENDNEPSTTVKVHETTWTFNSSVFINAYKDTRYKPTLHVPHVERMQEIDFWMAFFPNEEIDFILNCTNAHLRERRKLITKAEFYKALGIMYAMTLNVLHTRRDYWATEPGLYPAPAFGQRFGMGLHRFEEIISSLAFTMPNNNHEEVEDKWYQVRPFFDMTIRKWQDIFTPGYKLTADESMFAWYGKGLYHEENGMPSVIKIKRKPKGVGCECKTIADVQSGIMVGLEINEGKIEMQKKEWQKELGAGTATTLRLTRPWHGTGRIIIADSWFGSVKTAVELFKRGLYFLGIVKTATKNYPLAEAKIRCPMERGKFSCAVTVVEPNIHLTCIAWRDKKIHTFVGSCSTTLEGEPAKKKRIDDLGRPIIKEVTRPKLVEEYFDGAPAVDIHNHIRQDGLSLEGIWNTQRWHHRMFACLLGIIEANAFLAYKYFKKEPNVKHADFTESLALQLIRNNNDCQQIDPNRIPRNAAPPERVPNPPAHEGLAGDHTLVPLSRDDERKRVQRKCIICSRIHRRQQKASYYCSACGPRAVMCSPTTGRNCFTFHIQNGIPA